MRLTSVLLCIALTSFTVTRPHRSHALPTSRAVVESAEIRSIQQVPRRALFIRSPGGFGEEKSGSETPKDKSSGRHWGQHGATSSTLGTNGPEVWETFRFGFEKEETQSNRDSTILNKSLQQTVARGSHDRDSVALPKSDIDDKSTGEKSIDQTVFSGPYDRDSITQRPSRSDILPVAHQKSRQGSSAVAAAEHKTKHPLALSHTSTVIGPRPSGSKTFPIQQTMSSIFHIRRVRAPKGSPKRGHWRKLSDTLKLGNAFSGRKEKPKGASSREVGEKSELAGDAATIEQLKADPKLVVGLHHPVYLGQGFSPKLEPISGVGKRLQKADP